ncbi:MAG: LAGLIDADG family homing endonuclease, partial [Candidatus Paceibacterota bacterium]
GSSFYYCTEEHQWPVLYGNGSLVKTLTSELETGDKIPINLSEKTYGNLGSYSDGFLVGWIYGDGWITTRSDNGKKQVGIIVSKKDAENGIKDKLNEKLVEIGIKTSWPERKNRNSIWYEINTSNLNLIEFLENFGSKNKRDGLPAKIWNECSKEFVIGFLDGIISSDGYVEKNRIIITTAHHTLAEELQEFLGFLGIASNCNKRVSYGNFDSDKNYEAYDICFSPRFANDWHLSNNYKNESLRQLNKKRDYYFRTIESVEQTNIFEDVWDIRVYDETHCFALANVITGNCSEQPLPINAACNIGSFDLSKFIKKNKEFDYEKFEIAVRLSVNFLDAVIDVSDYPTKEIEEWSYHNRPLGNGIMGIADYFLIKEIAYGSNQSLKELDDILSFMLKIAEDESIILGKKLGVPEECKKLPIPRRNITLETIAPTGSVSMFAGCSSGVEPVFSEITIRNDKTGTYTFENDLADKPYFRCAVSANGAQEVTWEEHVKMLATAQKHIDSGVSKTINFPTLTRRETIAKAVFMAWELGCKGIATYRNGSRKTEVLSPKNIKKDKCPVCGNELIEINGKMKCPSCKPKEESSSYYD